MSGIHRNEIDHDAVRKHFDYDPVTGNLIWKIKRGNKAPVGTIAGCDNGRGYQVVGFLGKLRMLHRLVWAYFNDFCPDHLDHINGDSRDNRIENLRPCTQAANNQNMAVRRNKTSALKGVAIYRKGDWVRWRARIVVGKREIALGYFTTEQEAHAAYAAAAALHFGEFARTT